MSGCGRGGPVILFPVMLALGSLTIAVPTSAQSSAALQEQNYDIPPQPLRTALARFARISRVDILYDDGLATGRKSAAVQGWLTPQQALEALLARTGLSFRFTRPNAALIYAASAGPTIGYRPQGLEPVLTLDVLHVRATPFIRPRPSFDSYGRQILQAIDRRMRPEAAASRRAYSAVVRLWIADDGAIGRVEFARGTGSDAQDRLIAAQISSLRLDPPPPEMPQPVRLQLENR